MGPKIRLVVPQARVALAPDIGRLHTLQRNNLRVGILDNSKANADHLLGYIVQGIKAGLHVKSMIVLRKAVASISAPTAFFDQFAAEADFVISALAD